MVSFLGVLSAVMLFVFAKPLARILSGGGDAVCAPSLMMLSPALLVMGIISSRKGFFQGKSVMTPSALGQLGESLIKVVLGIGLCAVFVKKGIAYGAAGAIAGVTAGAFIQAIVLESFYRRENKIKGTYSTKKALEVFKISVPMTLGAFGFTAVMLLDSLTVPKLLVSVGESFPERLALMGYLTRAMTIYNLPATVISAFTASAVPALARARAEGDRGKSGESSVRVIKLILLAALPCALGMMLFPKELFLLIYSSKSHASLLALYGMIVIIMPYVQTTTAMLQTLGKVWAPIWVTVGAVVLKAILNVVFVKAFGIAGAPFATIAAFSVAVIINTFMLTRLTSLKGAVKVAGKILLCALLSCGGARLIYNTVPSVITLLLCVMLAATLYFALIFIFRCITKSEILGKE